MYLAYFDENKHSETDPNFYIGGLLINDKNVIKFENTLSQIQYNFFGSSILSKDTELHGKEIFHGKGNFKKHKILIRIKLLEDIATFLIKEKPSIRIVCIDVQTHREKYTYPQPEYQLGLMLILERFCDFLEQQNDIGIVFGDYEQEEMSQAVLDFSQFKFSGKTTMFRGRPLGRIIDTIYFTHSHHSRFLQIADIIIYMANRFEKVFSEPEKWHEKKGWNIWMRIKDKTDFKMQRWP